MFESKINRGKVNGYAPLDSEGKVPLDKTYVGANGTSGTSGVNGSMGSSGQSGTSGIDGTNGTNGTSAFENIDITTFATTGSNQFYGEQSISGSVNISSSLVVSSTFVNSGSIEALNSDLIIDGGNIIVTGSLFVSGTLSLGGDVSAQTTETISNTLEGGGVFVNKQTDAFQYTSYNGGPELSLDIEYQKPLTREIGINTLAIGFADETVQTTAFLNNGVVSSSQQINNYDVFATTGSNIFNGEQTITGSLYVSSSLKISNGFYVDGNKQFNYASFSDLTIQSASANIAYPMKLNTTDLVEGFSVVSGSRITAVNGGTYNLQFSAQLEQTTNHAAEISIWFRKNGTDIPNSNTELTIEKISGGGKLVAAWNYILQLQSTEYVEIMWASTRSDTTLHYHAVQSTPTRPATPSVIVTMTQIA